jgi:hypothetical protein
LLEGGVTCASTLSVGVLITQRGYIVGTCLVGAAPEFMPIALRLGTAMPNQDLSGAWVTVCE